jgi:exonuclease III
VAHLNARSARNKGDAIIDVISDNQIDVLALTETWFSPDQDESTLSSATPEGYVIHHVPRSSGRGGGVAVIYRSTITVKVNDIHKQATFEHLDMTISHANETIRLLVIYRPPSTNISNFIEDFSKITDQLNITGGKLLIMGDFNIHVDNVADKGAQSFQSFLNGNNLSQHVSKATHEGGHTLDLIITRPSELIISEIACDYSIRSDHATVICKMSIPKPLTSKQTISYRNW